MSAPYDAIIVGGGLAGCAAAIPLARAGRRVLLLEAGRYPRQKVCGEFVSAEAMPALLELLGSPEPFAGAPRIARVRFLWGDRVAEAPVNPQACSISRTQLDDLLWHAAAAAGAEVRDNTTAGAMTRSEDGFVVQTATGELCGQHLIDASGRWSRMRAEQRPAGAKIGIKAHVRGDGSSESVDLYFFPGGYCGVQSAGADELNVCALVDARAARSLQAVVALHPALSERAHDWSVLAPECVTSPVQRRRPRPMEDGILRVGDAAGFLEPLFGDGISVALRGGMLAAASVLDPRMDYARAYNRRFRRVFLGATLAARMFSLPRVAHTLLWPLMRYNPGLVGAFSRAAR